MYLYIKRK